VYACRRTTHWDHFLSFLVPFNYSWAQNASVLVIVFASKILERDGSPFPTHSFDAGGACENLSLQATFQGLVTHTIEGFDHDRVRKELAIPDTYVVEAMIVIGKRGDAKKLPKHLEELEKPSERKPISEIVSEGVFAFK
jgi:nitroreductase